MLEVKLTELEIDVLISLLKAEIVLHTNVPWEYTTALNALIKTKEK